MILIVISILLSLLYTGLMLAYRWGFEHQQDFIADNSASPGKTFISVIIPARNESANIRACIESIIHQSYPKELYEIIVVDDHSEDDTAAIVNTFTKSGIKCIDLQTHLTDKGQINAYKKAALTAGISESKGSLIVTTDADCIAPYEWLKQIAAIYERTQAMMIIAPVVFECRNTAVELLQLIDFMSMQGITAATYRLRLGLMSNGANLAFSKDAFQKVNGYDGVTHLASGDDYLLMMKIKSVWPGQIAYLKSKSAIITTTPQPNWASFLQQRIRWSSKSGKYPDRKMTAILLLVYLYNISFLAVLAASFFSIQFLFLLIAMLVLKILGEQYFLQPVASFFDKKYALKYHPLLQPLHIIYIVIAGFLGFVGGYKWKGRRVH